MKDKDLLNLLKKIGWEVKRIHGSRHSMQKAGKMESTTLQGKDVPTGSMKRVF